VVFGSDQNALRIDESLVSGYRLPTPSRYVSGVLKQHAETLLKRLEHSQSMRGRVESLLMPMLHTRGVSVDTVAGKLGVSRQTLFRRLRTEGVTFEQVLDELRYALSLHHLSVTKGSVHRTAGLVGYSDPAAFSRAFKRWTGSSPRMYLSR
jgi:AraC-like DNA-binding protein